MALQRSDVSIVSWLCTQVLALYKTQLWRWFNLDLVFFFFCLSISYRSKFLISLMLLFSVSTIPASYPLFFAHARVILQVDLRVICSTGQPLPLSQGVLLALVQQLACDIGHETSRKVGWMTDVAVAINPADPMIAQHVRPIFEQVYNMLGHQMAFPTSSASEAASVRLLMHVINSVLTTCK